MSHHPHLVEYATSRPRVLGWKRSAAFLDGDWGTSIAYVIGIGFFLAGYQSFWYLMMMLLLTSLVALNYITVCRLNPNGGGVYSTVYHRSKTFAVIGALLLAADYIITTCLSILEAAHYLDIAHPEVAAIVFILAIGVINWFGPKNSGALAVVISLFAFTSLSILIIKFLLFPGEYSVTNAFQRIEGIHSEFSSSWAIFVGLILSISGIEAISNMTGLMRDPAKDSKRAILTVLAKVAIGTIIVGLAMHAIPNLDPIAHKEDMVRHIGEVHIGQWFGWLIGISFGVLLLSAGNTAINGLISVQFLMSVDRELPTSLRKVNKHGVPIIPLIIAVAAPIIVLLAVMTLASKGHASETSGGIIILLAQLYAIGVVGAITINLAFTSTDKAHKMKWHVRGLMFLSAVILFFVELTIVIEKTNATIFVLIILVVGLSARSLARRAKAPVPAPVLQTATSAVRQRRKAKKPSVRKFLIGLKDLKNERLLRFALEEAALLNASVIVLRVLEIKVGSLPEKLFIQTDETESRFEELCADSGVDYQIITIPSNEVGYTIAEYAAMFGVDRVILGSPSRGALAHALRGNVMKTVGSLLPDEIQLVIFAG